MSEPNVSRITSDDLLNFERCGIQDEVSDISKDDLTNDYNAGIAQLEQIPNSQDAVYCDVDVEPPEDQYGYYLKSYKELRDERVAITRNIAVREYHIQNNDPKKLLRKLRELAIIHTVSKNEELPKIVQDFNLLMLLYRTAKDDKYFCEQAIQVVNGCREAYHSVTDDLSDARNRLTIIDAVLPIAEKKEILEEEEKIRKSIHKDPPHEAFVKCARHRTCDREAGHRGACRKRVKPY